MTSIATLPRHAVRRLALVRAGLLAAPEDPVETVLTPAPRQAPPDGSPPPRRNRAEHRHRDAALAVIRRFGYLQLDTVSVAGARSHTLVLLSRLAQFPPALGELLLQPGEPLFEYWGHEACWIPGELFPALAFRRHAFQVHPWWGDVLTAKRPLAERILATIASSGPLRSADLEGQGGKGWWNLKESKVVANALWSAGELAVRERRAFQRTFDLPERVFPAAWQQPLSEHDGVRILLLRALAGHGWATTGTLASTWRLRNMRPTIDRALAELSETGEVVAADLTLDDTNTGKRIRGWIRPADLALADRLETTKPRGSGGVLLSPFDPLLWDRARVLTLFGFDATIEIFKRAADRTWGYYCLPVLAGERLVGRVDLQADRRRGRLNLLARHLEPTTSKRDTAAAERAIDTALARYAETLGLALGVGRYDSTAAAD